MTIEFIFDIVNLVLNKNRRGFVKTSQKTTAIKAAMYSFFNDEVEVYRKTGVIPTSIKKFVKTSELTLTNGSANLPTDFSQESNIETDCGSEGVILTPEQYLDRKNSYILAPDQQNPIVKIENGKVYVQPDEFTTITLTYIRQPIPFVYAVTVGGDNRSESFNSGSSTDIEFPIDYAWEIARRALAPLGVGFQNVEALQLSVNDNQK
jgi:hypothetical protein